MNLDHAVRTTESGPLGIDVQGAARRFGSRWVLRGVDLRVRTGEIVALTGRNGSGKTTILRMLATLLRPSRGVIRVFGVDVVDSPDSVRARLGFLAHNPGVYDDLTADENLMFAQRMMGLGSSAAQRAAVFERVGLADASHERARDFSAGMRRRLALGRLLLRPPGLLLLDEPYASFDTDGIALVNEMAREVAARGGSVVIATHDLDRASVVMDSRVDVREGLAYPVAASERGLHLVRGGA